jgi:hypothetical protein
MDETEKKDMALYTGGTSQDIAAVANSYKYAWKLDM